MKSRKNMEFISDAVNGLVGELLLSKSKSSTRLGLIQDMCRNYKDCTISPYVYWVLKNNSHKLMPDIVDPCNGLILLSSIDSAKNISDRLGICIQHPE